MVCWLGTYGINEHTQRKEADRELEGLFIRRWRYGSFAKIASDKRMYLNSDEAFWSNILTDFNPALKHRRLLVRLAWELRATLVERKEPGCKGSFKRSKGDVPLSVLGLHNANSYVDPFERRTNHWKAISAELLG
ncbi:hypothetical protein EV182_008943, partial [Spiromyces aspiralis]